MEISKNYSRERSNLVADMAMKEVPISVAPGVICPQLDAIFCKNYLDVNLNMPQDLYSCGVIFRIWREQDKCTKHVWISFLIKRFVQMFRTLASNTDLSVLWSLALLLQPFLFHSCTLCIMKQIFIHSNPPYL